MTMFAPKSTKTVYKVTVRTPGYTFDWEIPGDDIREAIDHADHLCAYFGIEEWEVCKIILAADDIPF